MKKVIAFVSAIFVSISVSLYLYYLTLMPDFSDIKIDED